MVAPRWALPLIVLPLAVLGGSAGCSPDNRHRVLTLLFEQVPPPGSQDQPVPVVRSPRHPLRATPTPSPTPAAAPESGRPGLAGFSTWEELERLLPKNGVGTVDWVRALEEKIIAPRPGIQLGAQTAEALSLDVLLTAKSDPAFSVTFSHRKHGEWLDCANCHPDLFAMSAGGTSMTPQEVHGDKYCATCHGRVAFDMASGCPLCHVQNLPKDAYGRVNWTRALADQLIAPRPGPRAAEAPARFDLDVGLHTSKDPNYHAVFSHSEHTQWLACANCHPRPFPTNTGSQGAAGIDLHGRRYCGSCHGSVAFGIGNECARCHPALEKARQHQEVVNLDVEVPSATQPSGRTTFSHTTHRFVECARCHTSLFESPAGAAKITTAEVAQGKYCATCHGKVASDLIAQCQRCHAELAEEQ